MIFYPGLGKKFSGNELDYESSGGRFIKFPEHTRVIRGKGSFDKKSNFEGNEEFELTFTANETKLLDFLKIYHLSSTLGIVHIKDWDLFKTFYEHHLLSLEEKANSTFFDINLNNKTANSKDFKASNAEYFAKIRKQCDGNIMALMKTFKVVTVPNTTNTYQISMTLIPYVNCINFVIKKASFYSDFYHIFNTKYSEKVGTLFRDIESNYLNAKNKTFKFSFVNKNIVPSGDVQNVESLKSFNTFDFNIDERFVDGFEIILHNNIISIPMQSGLPNFQHLGKAESSFTLNMNFARQSLGTDKQDEFNKIVTKLKVFSRLEQKDYSFSPLPDQHFLLKSLSLSSFSIQGLVNNDIESDEFQMSNVSVMFLANSYGLDESFQNVLEYPDKPTNKIHAAFDSYNNFLGYLIKKIGTAEENVYVKTLMEKFKILDYSLWDIISAGNKAFPHFIKGKALVNDNFGGGVSLNAGIVGTDTIGDSSKASSADVMSPYQTKLIHAISLFPFNKKKKELNILDSEMKFAIDELFYFPIFYVQGAVSSPGSPNYTLTGLVQFHLFRALYLHMVKTSPQYAGKMATVDDAILHVRKTYFKTEVNMESAIVRLALEGIKKEYGDKINDNVVVSSFTKELKTQMEVMKTNFNSTFGFKSDSDVVSNTVSKDNTRLLVAIHKKSIELYFKLNFPKGSKDGSYDNNRLVSIKYAINYLSIFYSGFWANSSNHLGRFERGIAEAFANKYSAPLKVLLDGEYGKNKSVVGYVRTLFGAKVKDLADTAKSNNFGIDITAASDCNPLVGGEPFWDNEHLSDVIDLVFAGISDNTKILKKIKDFAAKKSSYSNAVAEESEDTSLHETAVDPDDFSESVSKLMKNFGYNYINTYDQSDFFRNELGWYRSLGTLINLMERDYNNILPIFRLEFANVDFITGLLQDTPFKSLERSGYAGKITDVVTATNRITKVTTCEVTMVDVEQLINMPHTYSNSETIGEKGKVTQVGTKVFTTDLYRPSFPMKEGTIVRLFAGGSHKSVCNIFNGTIKKIMFENGLIKITCASFADELYNGEVGIALGKGGIGILSTLVSFKNIKNLAKTNDLAMDLSHGADYKEVIKKMLLAHSGLNRNKIAFDTVDVDSQFQETAAQYIIALTAVEYQASLPFLTSQVFNSFDTGAVTSALKQFTTGNTVKVWKDGASAFTTNGASRGDHDLMKNVYNVDFDFNTYGVGIYSKRLLWPWLWDVIGIIVFFWGGAILGKFGKLKTGLPALGRMVISKGKGTAAAWGESKVLSFALSKKLVSAGGKFIGKIMPKLTSSFVGKLVGKTFTKNMLQLVDKSIAHYLWALTVANVPVLVNTVISSGARSLTINRKELLKINADGGLKDGENVIGPLALNSSSYIPGVIKPQEGGKYELIIAKEDGRLQTKVGQGISFTYETKDSFGNILNEMEKRYPGAEWDVIESGGYATLFFGRNNYDLVRTPFAVTGLPFNYKKADKGFIELAKQFSLGTIVSRGVGGTVQQKMEAAKELLDMLDAINGYFTAGNVQDPETNEYYQHLSAKDDLKTSAEDPGVEKFRNKVYAISGKNLISCNITTNDNFSNSIKIEYDVSLIGSVTLDFMGFMRKVIGKDSNMSDFTLRSFWNLPDHFMRIKTIPKEFSKNANSEFQAREQAAKAMEEEFKEYYDGKIIMDYDGTIRRGTEIVLCDTVNQIFGCVIAKEVSHVLSADRGLVTVVTPGMKTEFKSPMSSFSLFDIYVEAFGIMAGGLDRTKKGNGYKEREEVKILNDVMFAENLMPITYNFGFDMYYAEKSSNEGDVDKLKASELNPLRNMLTQPLILSPLYIKGKLAYPDELIYNAYSQKYNLVRAFFGGLDSLMFTTMMGSEMFGKSLFYNVTNFLKTSVRLSESLWKGEDIATIMTIDSYNDSMGWAIGDVRDALEEDFEYYNDASGGGDGGFGGGGNDPNGLIPIFTFNQDPNQIDKVPVPTGEHYKSIITFEEKLSGFKLSTAKSRVFSSSEITAPPQNIREFDLANERTKFYYQSLKVLTFDNLTAFPLDQWAILNAMAMAYRNADVLVLTELVEYYTVPNSRQTTQSLHNRLNAIKNVFNAYTTWESIKLYVLKHNYDYVEYYLVCNKSSKDYKVTTRTYKEPNVSARDEAGKIRNVIFVEATCLKDKTEKNIFTSGSKYPVTAAFVHTYYGLADNSSDDKTQAKIHAKREAFRNLIELCTETVPVDLLIGDLNFNMIPTNDTSTDFANEFQIPEYFEKNLVSGKTTQGGEKYDTVLFKDYDNLVQPNASINDAGMVNFFRYSDHKGIYVKI